MFRKKQLKNKLGGCMNIDPVKDILESFDIPKTFVNQSGVKAVLDSLVNPLNEKIRQLEQEKEQLKTKLENSEKAIKELRKDA